MGRRHYIYMTEAQRDKRDKEKLISGIALLAVMLILYGIL